MKQFNLEEYLKDTTQKVVTRDGTSVRMVCTDVMDNTYPIIALVVVEDEEYVYTYTKDGENCLGEIRDNDLFFADKETYRPYANADECFVDMQKHGMIVKHNDGDYHLIVTISDRVIWLGNASRGIDMGRLMEEFKYLDGSPCGVKE